MQIRDLTNFEELTVPEASKVIGGKKKKKKKFPVVDCANGDAGNPPPRLPRVVRSCKSSRP